MRYTVLKPFPLSDDGVTSRSVSPGEEVEVRADLVPGLKAEGYISAGNVGETKVIERAPQFGHAVGLDDTSQGLSLREIHADLEGAGAAFDPREDRDALLAQRDEARAGRAAPDVPADWEGLHWTKRVALAKRLQPDAADIDATTANAIIAAALAKA